MSWLAGIHPVSAALAGSPERIKELLVARGQRNRRVAELTEQARSAGIAVRSVPREELERIAEGARHQDVAARYRAPEALDDNGLEALLDASEGEPLVLVLDGVTDPHNLGACLRVADGAGCTVVVVPKDRAVGLSPAVLKTASGAAESMPLARVTNLARTLKRLKERGIWVAGAADESAQNYLEAPLDGPLALVVGAEGKGLRRLTRETCDFLVSIPMHGAVSSLNVSVATGILLYEIRRRRM